MIRTVLPSGSSSCRCMGPRNLNRRMRWARGSTSRGGGRGLLGQTIVKWAFQPMHASLCSAACLFFLLAGGPYGSSGGWSTRGIKIEISGDGARRISGNYCGRSSVLSTLFACFAVILWA